MIKIVLIYILIGVIISWYLEKNYIKNFDYNQIKYYNKSHTQISREVFEELYGPVENHFYPQWENGLRFFTIITWPYSLLYILYIFIISFKK